MRPLGLAPVATHSTPEERKAIGCHAVGLRRLVEIGFWHDVAIRRVRRFMSPDGVLFEVDPYPVGHFRFGRSG